ncbi:MAG TPA: methyltransferase domain-containing protein [Acidisarcina sp.]
MPLRDLFLRNIGLTSAKPVEGSTGAEASRTSAKQEQPAPGTPAPEIADTGQPTHIPHRGLPPFRPQSHASDAATASPPAAVHQPPVVPGSASVPVPAPALRDPAAANPRVTAQRATQPADERRSPREERRSGTAGPRIPRHSSGWSAILKHLKAEPSQRVLDFGPTSPNNINFLTGMGHSVYMADLVQEALSGQWERLTADHEAPALDETGFFSSNLDLGDRRFDVVLLWTTIDYLPDSLIPPLIARLHASMQPGAQLLAFFHTKSLGAETAFCRYHLVDSSNIEMQENARYPVLHVYTNREIERLFNAFAGCRFFLARDNVYEVIITR